MLPDAHIHLAALEIDPSKARPALCVTCTPDEFALALPRFKHAALGLHPWMITDENADELLDKFMQQLPKTQLIGEVGLDFYKRYAQFGSVQLKCFHFICASLKQGHHVISLHSRAADRETLDILESNGLSTSSTCVMHGFNGSGDQLARAVEMGCMFSIGPRQLATKRGREYARQLPAQRILLETDADGSKPFTADDWEATLESALATLNEIKGFDMRDTITENFDRTMSFA